MTNRGNVSMDTIADKLRKVEDTLGIESKEEKAKFSDPSLLFINGRLDRKNHTYVPKNFAILEKLNDQIKKTCKGSDLSVLNYLLYLGLKHVQSNSKLEVIEYSDLESKI